MAPKLSDREPVMSNGAKSSAKRSRGTQFPVDLSKLVRYEEVTNGAWYRVGSGNARVGSYGRTIGIIALKHSSGYEVVLQLTDGTVDTFSPMQLFPAKDDEIPETDTINQLQLAL